MPEMTKERRAQGPWIADGVQVRRHFTVDDAGPLCPVCGTPVVKQLVTHGITEHPSCGEVEW